MGQSKEIPPSESLVNFQKDACNTCHIPSKCYSLLRTSDLAPATPTLPWRWPLKSFSVLVDLNMHTPLLAESDANGISCRPTCEQIKIHFSISEERDRRLYLPSGSATVPISISQTSGRGRLVHTISPRSYCAHHLVNKHECSQHCHSTQEGLQGQSAAINSGMDSKAHCLQAWNLCSWLSITFFQTPYIHLHT